MSRNELLSHFCETPSAWSGKLNAPCSGFAKGPKFLNMVMTFTLTPLSHYNSIPKPHARFLLALMEDLSIDFPSHFITSILDVYQDMETRDNLIYHSFIMRILHHFSIPFLDSPYFITMGAISIGSIRQSEAQLQLRWPRVETSSPSVSAGPSTPTPSSSASKVTLEAIIAQLQCMDARLDTLFDDLC